MNGENIYWLPDIYIFWFQIWKIHSRLFKYLDIFQVVMIEIFWFIDRFSFYIEISSVKK